MTNPDWIIGIDEAGRGPLAGPVAVGAVAMRFDDYNKEKLIAEKIHDSKKLTEKGREKWFEWMKAETKAGRMHYVVSLVSARTIDEHGIVSSIAAGIKNCLDKLEKKIAMVYLEAELPSKPLLDNLAHYAGQIEILLDGGLKAPDKFTNQKTIIRGDESEPIISLASIAAKVTRDAMMIELGKKFPNYGFEKHKGYGTKVHIEKILRHGISLEHRISFCEGITRQQ
ncbi:MAG: ribonuclease HII [Candidatus Vogelbacteria bacterium]|nr:ribonuclease HII [Candidatus Vogelbacteria bacterium]